MGAQMKEPIGKAKTLPPRPATTCLVGAGRTLLHLRNQNRAVAGTSRWMGGTGYRQHVPQYDTLRPLVEVSRMSRILISNREVYELTLL
jgi:hypothetical protein